MADKVFLQELPQLGSCIGVVAMLVKAELLPKATDLLFRMYQQGVILGVPELLYVLSALALGSAQISNHRTVTTFIQVSVCLNSVFIICKII